MKDYPQHNLHSGNVHKKRKKYTEMPKIVQNRPLMYPCSNNPEAVARRCSVKKAFLEISQNSQENTSAGVSVVYHF